MDEKDQKAGTDRPDETGDDAAKAALAESAEAADRDAESEGQDDGKRTDWKALALTYKGKAEANNKLEAEIEDLRSQLEAKPSPTADPKAQQENDVLNELVGQIQALDAKFAETKDPAYSGAATAIRLQLVDRQERAIERRNEQRERDDHDYLMSATEPDEDGEDRPLTPKRREELRAFFKKNRAHLPSMEVAHDNLMGREARQSKAQLAKEKKSLRKDEDLRDAGVVKTNTRDVSAREAAGRMLTRDQYKTKLAKLEETDPDAAWKLKQDVMAGRIPVR